VHDDLPINPGFEKARDLNPDFDPKQCTAEFINQDTPSQLMEKRRNRGWSVSKLQRLESLGKLFRRSLNVSL
jgi:hypothetical protein